MSTQDKDPRGKKDTPSESNESHSDSEVEKAEENLDHLKLQERSSKEEDSDESRSSFPSNQERTIVSEEGPQTVPIAKSWKLKESHEPFSDVQSDPGPQASCGFDLQEEKNVESKGFSESTESVTAESTPSYVSPPPTESLLDPPPIPPRREGLLQNMPPPIPPKRYDLIRKLWHQSSSKSEGTPTLEGIASIVSEEATCSGGSGNFQEGQPSNVVPYLVRDLVRDISEASDSNISDIPDEYQETSSEIPVTPHTSSLSSTSTTSSTSSIGSIEQHSVPLLRKVADEWGVGPSLGVVSAKQFGFAEGKQSGLAGDEHPASEPLEALLFRRQQDLDESTLCAHLPKESQEVRDLEEAENAAIALKKDEERIEFSDSGAGSPSERRETSKHEVVPSAEGERIIRKTNDPLQSSHELTCRASSETKDSKVSPKPQTSRKSWQKPGLLRSMQLPPVKSMDIDLVEEVDPISPRRAPSPELMETGGNDESPKKMKITADETGLSELNPVLKSGDQSNIAEAEGASKGEEPTLERKARKSKRPDTKLTSSPPSDELQDSSPKKPETYRPPKKAKSDSESKKTRRTRHDSSNIPESVGPGYLHESQPSTSDGSSDEMETGL
ncbi:hypothetical protein HNY73_007298 [Argiope bruennichi]|uniref:Uncharacterized protein n=1 Tax=Argiope bruennichi TaxID=94029 RepID=A0A8T0FDI7_ARGBR|nr:hypothetical protein HNY73_007298 [Argiope bruennichi]